MGALDRRAWVGLSALAIGVLILLLVIFSSVRNAGQQFLNLFRVQEVQTVQLTQEFLDSLPEPDAELIQWVEEPTGDGEPREVTLDEAEDALGFRMARLSALPESLQPEPKVMITDEEEASFTIDLPVARNYIWALGGDGTILPDNMEGAVFRVTMPQVGMLFYATKEDAEQGVRFIQTTSPTLAVPDEIDMDSIREGLLELEILPPELAAQLRAIDDWESTLVLPLVEGMSEEVSVGSATAVRFFGVDDDERMLVWVAQGRIHVLSTNIPELDLAALAENIR
ncbi:MAG: hypothetical protein F4X83_02600 [Chloroflexi bacterium]|nr:hypothetical protein [Chloroflexota bacterium]